MPDGYDSHADYMGWVKTDSEARAHEVRATLVRAFAKFVELREIEVINFSAMTALDLAVATAIGGALKGATECCFSSVYDASRPSFRHIRASINRVGSLWNSIS